MPELLKKPQPIRISVPGELCGKYFAVNRSFEPGFNVTHLPTGMAVVTGVRELSGARKIARLLASAKVPWNFTDAKMTLKNEARVAWWKANKDRIVRIRDGNTEYD